MHLVQQHSEFSVVTLTAREVVHLKLLYVSLRGSERNDGVLLRAGAGRSLV